MEDNRREIAHIFRNLNLSNLADFVEDASEEKILEILQRLESALEGISIKNGDISSATIHLQISAEMIEEAKNNLETNIQLGLVDASDIGKKLSDEIRRLAFQKKLSELHDFCSKTSRCYSASIAFRTFSTEEIMKVFQDISRSGKTQSTLIHQFNERINAKEKEMGVDNLSDDTLLNIWQGIKK